MEKLELLKKRSARERKGRKAAEEIAENALRELYEKNTKLVELTEHIEEQHRVLQTAHLEMEADLITAKGIQQHLFLDYITPSFLRIATRYFPHSHVSGDIFKLYLNRSGSFNMFLGDSTGHGVTAALSTMMAHVLLSDTEEASPREVLNYLNTNLLRHLSDGRFMTAAQVSISPEGLLTTSNAGHPALILLPGDGSEIKLVASDSTVLGVFEEPVFDAEESKLQLQRGDKGLLYTDGITEWADAHDAMFGIENLVSFLKNNRFLALENLLSTLMEHMERFSGGNPVNDDVTLVAFDYTG